MTCCRVVDSKKEQGLSPFSYMQKKKNFWSFLCIQFGLLCPWDFPGKNIAMGCHAFLQGIFQTHPGIKSETPASPVVQVCSLPDEPLGSPGAFCYFLDF